MQKHVGPWGRETAFFFEEENWWCVMWSENLLAFVQSGEDHWAKGLCLLWCHCKCPACPAEPPRRALVGELLGLRPCFFLLFDNFFVFPPPPKGKNKTFATVHFFYFVKQHNIMMFFFLLSNMLLFWYIFVLFQQLFKYGQDLFSRLPQMNCRFDAAICLFLGWLLLLGQLLSYHLVQTKVLPDKGMVSAVFGGIDNQSPCSLLRILSVPLLFSLLSLWCVCVCEGVAYEDKCKQGQ